MYRVSVKKKTLQSYMLYKIFFLWEKKFQAEQSHTYQLTHLVLQVSREHSLPMHGMSLPFSSLHSAN